MQQVQRLEGKALKTNPPQSSERGASDSWDSTDWSGCGGTVDSFSFRNKNGQNAGEECDAQIMATTME